MLNCIRMRLREAVTGIVAACDCPDRSVDTTAFASWDRYKAEIDACVASDLACEALCRRALQVDPTEAIAIPKFVITSISAAGAALDIEYLRPVECGAGRKPAGLVHPARKRGTGAWLAAVATLEAASVTAFARLARILTKLEAPRKLVEAARRAIVDELQHASAVSRLAHARGVMAEAPVIEEATDEGNVFELAIENAVEGEVGETFGALVAACQARAATDADVREVFARIAIDEARHAALAHQLAPWFERRLGLLSRNAVARARQEAISKTLANCDFGLAPLEREELGVPAPEQLRAAARQLFATV